jgi:hypothetical protein
MTFRLDGWRFPAVLGLLLCALLALFAPSYSGDVAEYSLDTIALATHGTPDIRLADLERGKQLAPALGTPYGLLEQGMREGTPRLYAAFTRGREGEVYSVHFFGYSVLAVLPYKVFERFGVAPFKAFQVVNLAAIFILGLALRRFFGSSARAFAGLGLFMLCGGMLYLNWTSPELMSAAALLSGLLLFACGAPIAGSLLAGLAAQQNPTIVMFFGFAPLLLLLHGYRPGLGLGANLRALLGRRHLAGLALGLALFALPPLFNLYQFGVPNIIAKLFSDPELVSLVRLASFYFDLNQGMIIGVPAVLAALALWGWNRQRARREAMVLAACAAFTLALAVPALAVLNWNSGAAGVMRYAFWAAMPFLFALLLRLHDRARWPAPLVAALGLAQAACMVSALSYAYVEFSPLARVLLAYAPQLYHPEPEIFAERSGRNDDYIAPGKIYAYTLAGRTVKTLVNVANPGADALLCGAGGALAWDNDYVDTTRGWRYIDGPVRCRTERLAQRNFQIDQFQAQAGIRLAAGWSAPENNGGAWSGVWSNGARSRLVVEPGGGLRPVTLMLAGNYFDGNRRTRVRVNGADLGWHRLDQAGPMPLPASAAGGAPLEIELEHEAPHPAEGGDRRALAFFLREVSLRQDPVATTSARR